MSVRKQNPVALARAYAELSQSGLAAKIGTTQPYIAKLEGGDAPFEPYAEALSTATGLKSSFFSSSNDWNTTDGAISFRKRSRCPAPIRNKADFYLSVAHSILEPMIAEHVVYPEPNVQLIPMDVPSNIHAARMAGGQVARVVRERWAIGWGPITDVLQVIESFGVRVFFVKEFAEHLDGFAAWVDKTPYIFINQLVNDPARIRLDLLHELGHLVMHKECAMDASTDLYEAMAHGFAAEFLAPWVSLRKEVSPMPDLRMLGRLRARWKMSMQSLVMHMHANGEISDAVYANLFKRFAILGYRRGPEPGWFVPDQSVIHSKFLEVIESKGLSLANLAESAGLPETLAGNMIPLSTEVGAFNSPF